MAPGMSGVLRAVDINGDNLCERQDLFKTLFYRRLARNRTHGCGGNMFAESGVWWCSELTRR